MTGRLKRPKTGDAVTLTLTDELDITRGDILVAPNARPEVSEQFAAHVIWMDQEPLFHGRSYLIRIGTKTVPASITAIKYKINVNTQEHLAAQTLASQRHRILQRFNRNAGCIRPIYGKPKDRIIHHHRPVHKSHRRRRHDCVWAAARNQYSSSVFARRKSRARRPEKQRPAIIWFTGLSGAGKSTIANIVEQRLNMDGHHTMMLDGDNVRHGLNRDLGIH